MRIVYFGTAPFAVPALRSLAPHVVMVVSQPDRPTGRGLKIQSSAVKEAALELGLPVVTPTKARDPEAVDLLKSLDADVFVVAAYGQILPQRVLDIPKHGCLNLHGSILPRWRGAAPVQRAIEAGDKETGVTLMQMDAGMDTGPILAIERTAIDPDETAGELMDRLGELAGDMADRLVPDYLAGKLKPVPQPEEGATHAAKITVEDSEINLDLPVQKLYDRYRAVTPAPGAWTAAPQGRLKLHRIALSALTTEGVSAGTVVSVRPKLVVSAQDGAIELLTVQPPGKPRMDGSNYANGARLTPGTRFSVTD